MSWRLRDQLRRDQGNQVKGNPVNGNQDQGNQAHENQDQGNQARENQDRGTIESALTLIPLMLLFLTVSQLGLSVYSHATTDQSTQGAVAYSAMGLATIPGQSNSPSWSKPPIALPLPGGGSVLVGERTAHIPSITPLLPGGDSFTSTGIAIQE